MLIKTKTGSEYKLNETEKLVVGGRILDEIHYIKLANIEVGERGLIYLQDGMILKTSTIVEIGD